MQLTIVDSTWISAITQQHRKTPKQLVDDVFGTSGIRPFCSIIDVPNWLTEGLLSRTDNDFKVDHIFLIF